MIRRACLCLLVLLVPGTAAAGSAHDTLVSVKAFYGGAKQMSATFEQEVVNATFGTKSKNTGTLKLKPKAKMRWDYHSKRTKKVDRSFVSNGKKLWLVDRRNKQIVIQKLQDTILPAAVTFLHGKGDLETTFTAALDTSGTYGASADTVVELTPKVSSAQYERLYLVVSTDGSVRESVVIDSSDNVNHFRFSNVDTTTRIAAATFNVDLKKYPKYRIVK